MSWSPDDLLTDADLKGYEEAILSRSGQSTWQARRTKALEDWLFPILTANGLDPFKLRTRAAVTKALAYTGSAYSDVTSATQDGTADDVNLATIFATPGTDYLYIGSDRPFRGLFVRELDAPSSASAVLTAAYWNGAWESFAALTDGTKKVAGKTFSGGGSIAWILPMDWQTRKVDGSDPLYWVRLSVSAVPTGAKAGQLGVIRASSLRAPATFRTLQLIFQEAPTGGDGPWAQKAEFYKDEADAALQRALQICGGEFDADGSDLIDGTEATQTVAEAGGRGGGVVLERG